MPPNPIFRELFRPAELAYRTCAPDGPAAGELIGREEWPPGGRELVYDRFMGVEAWQGPPLPPSRDGGGIAWNHYPHGRTYAYRYECTRLVKRFVETVYHCRLERTGDGREVARKLDGLKGYVESRRGRIDVRLKHYPAGSRRGPMTGAIVSTTGPISPDGGDYGHVFIIKGFEAPAAGEPHRVRAQIFEQNHSHWQAGRLIFPVGNRVVFRLDEGGGWRGRAYDDPTYEVLGWLNPERA